MMIMMKKYLPAIVLPLDMLGPSTVCLRFWNRAEFVSVELYVSRLAPFSLVPKASSGIVSHLFYGLFRNCQVRGGIPFDLSEEPNSPWTFGVIFFGVDIRSE